MMGLEEVTVGIENFLIRITYSLYTHAHFTDEKVLTMQNE